MPWERDRYDLAAQGAAKQAAALTHRLLAFSRRQTLAPVATDVDALVGGMENLVRRAVGFSIELCFVGSAGAWPALVDPNQLENALLNLHQRARRDAGRGTDHGGDRQSLDQERGALERDVEAGQYVTVQVGASENEAPQEHTIRRRALIAVHRYLPTSL